jgi:hypothetical protein
MVLRIPPPPFIPCVPQIFGRAAPLRRLSRLGQAPPRPHRLLPPVLDAGASCPRGAAAAAPSAKSLIYISQHGFRTFFAGPQSLWNPDISANDWLMQVRAARSFHRSRRCQPRMPQASSLNCYEYSARNLECDRPYAPAADESFRAQWLHYRQLKQVNSTRYVLCPSSALRLLTAVPAGH